MGKGARIKRERAEGKRKPNGQRWSNIPAGHTMIIPTFDKVRAGFMPVVIPTKASKLEEDEIDKGTREIDAESSSGESDPTV